MTPPPKLTVRGVALEHYNERTRAYLSVLAGINLDVFEGELLSIVGPSGCGKTTFLNAVDGLTKVTAGENRLDDPPGAGPGPERALRFPNDSPVPWRNELSNG